MGSVEYSWWILYISYVEKRMPSQEWTYKVFKCRIPQNSFLAESKNCEKLILVSAQISVCMSHPYADVVVNQFVLTLFFYKSGHHYHIHLCHRVYHRKHTLPNTKYHAHSHKSTDASNAKATKSLLLIFRLCRTQKQLFNVGHMCTYWPGFPLIEKCTISVTR